MQNLKRHKIAALAVFLTCFLKYENRKFQNLAGMCFFFFSFSPPGHCDNTLQKEEFLSACVLSQHIGSVEDKDLSQQ